MVDPNVLSTELWMPVKALVADRKEESGKCLGSFGVFATVGGNRECFGRLVQGAGSLRGTTSNVVRELVDEAL